MNTSKLILLIYLFSFLGNTKLNGQDKPIQLDIGAIKTELKDNAINLGIKYAKSLESLNGSQHLIDWDNAFFLFSPNFNVKTGNADAFSSIEAKLTGVFMVFRDTTIDSVITPNTARIFHTFPISVGAESNNRFNTINGIVEIGWVPWYQTQRIRKIPTFLKQTKLGLFIQAGYKFKNDSTGKLAVGGQVDQSEEKQDDAIARVKGSFGIDTKSIVNLSGVGVALVGSADGWYDFLNSEVYYTIEGKLRFYLTQDKDKFYDLKYQKGSGAPNFNKGDQFGMALTVTF